MNLKPEQLGKNIRKARQDHNMTQVGLADLLNVSESAISQWESGKTSPDLGIIPEICAILDISADWLLDVGSEKRNREINDICARANLVADAGREDEAAEILREGLKRFPSSDMIIYNLMLYTHDDSEAIELGEWILKNSKNDQYHFTAVHVLTYSYCNVGNREKAEELARSMPKLFCSSDMMLSHVLFGEKGLRHTQKVLQTLLQAMSTTISWICFWTKKAGCTCDIDILTTEKYIALIELMFEKGDYGFFNQSLGFDYMELAMKSAKARDKDSTLSYLSRVTDCVMDFIDYVYNSDFRYSSLLFEGLPCDRVLHNYSDNDATTMLSEYNLGNSVFDFVRDTEEFKVFVDRLSSVAGKWDAERMKNAHGQN